MSDTFHAPAPVGTSVALPPLVWIGSHPTMEDPEMRGTRLRRCVRCNCRSEFYSVRCEPGMIVHLIDPADVHDAPALFDGVAWAEPQAIQGAHQHWREQGYRVVRKPDGPAGESVHPRFRACPQCNEEAMAAGTLTPLHLPSPPPAQRPGGRAAW